jgi:hypothetical protein
MGKFNEWLNMIQDAMEYDIQQKIYIDLMSAWGEKEVAEKALADFKEKLPIACAKVRNEIDRVVHGTIDHTDMSFMSEE